MSGLFITATGTGIGKTYLTQQLLAFDRQNKGYFTASKPVISGWPHTNEEIQHTDTGIILEAQGLALTPHEINRCSPWRYYHPLTPSMAARKEGRPIDEKTLILHCQQSIKMAENESKCHLIEGVGGVMAPITDTMTNLTWMQALNCACLLVAGSYLGTISHTLTALHVLKSYQIPVLGLIVNETKDSTVSLAETIDLFKDMVSPVPVFSLPYQCEPDLTMLYFAALKLTKKALACDTL